MFEKSKSRLNSRCYHLPPPVPLVLAADEAMLAFARLPGMRWQRLEWSAQSRAH